MRGHGAHQALRMKNGAFKNMCHILIHDLHIYTGHQYHKLTTKTVREKLRIIVEIQREPNNQNLSISDVEKVEGPTEKLQNESISDMNQMEEKKTS